MKECQFPRARTDCLSRKFESELLVYDPERHVGHCLNSTAAAVWKLCDGRSSPSQIAAALSQGLSARMDEPVILLALDQLAEAHLLVEPQAWEVSVSRRAAMRRIGIAAAVVLPLVISVVAPTPAQAASCLHNNSPCVSNGQCCSGLCAPIVQRCVGG